MVPPSFFVSLSAVLFAIGASGVLLRRNALVILMSVEIMLNAANLAFAAFSLIWANLEGQVFVFMVLAVAAAEVAVGLAIMVAIYRARGSIDVDQVNLLKG